MFIWSGWGLLVPVFAFLGIVVSVPLCDLIAPGQVPVYAAMAGIIAAASTWIAGSYLHGRLWFIPIKYYAPIYLVAFGVVAFDQRQKEMSVASTGEAPLTAPAEPPAAPAAAPSEQTGANGNTSNAAPSSENTVRSWHKFGMLVWQLQNDIDKITDKPTQKAVASGDFDDGITLEAEASCDGMGVEFAFDTFRGRNAAPFAWNSDDKLPMRVRLDDGEVRTATAEAKYTNEAIILFYDPEAVQGTLQGALPHGEGNAGKLTDAFNAFIGGSALITLQQVAAGKLEDLASARSVRVELPLTDGSANVVDLNPRDQALRTIVHQCVADARTISAPPAPPTPTATVPPLGHYYSPDANLTFNPPREVTIPNGGSIKIYLTEEQSSGVLVRGKISILGQRYQVRGNGSFCIVRWVSNGQTMTGEIGVDQLGAVLDPSQAKACYMPYGTPGGVSLSSSDGG